MPDNNIELIRQIKDACSRNDATQLIDAMKRVSLDSTEEYVARLRALEVQIRLADVYILNLKNMHSLAPSQQEVLAAPTSIEGSLDRLSKLKESLESFLVSFDETLKSCFNGIPKPSFATTAIVDKLSNPASAAPIIKLLSAGSYHDQDWLINRAYTTKAGVDEGVWDSVNSIEAYIANAHSEEGESRGQVTLTEEDIARGVKTAMNELEMAVRGLLPGALEGLQHGN